MRALAPAKFNLCLLVGGARDDGRHELVTLFQSLSLCDSLTIEPLADGAADEVVCPGVARENLAARALAALRERGWRGPPVRITIDKRIPIAGGMGGGSGDAAATLRLALAFAPDDRLDLRGIAVELGADVPAQLEPGLTIGRGAGELLERVAPLAHHAALVLPLPDRLSSGEVYREADRLGLARSVAELEAAAAELERALAPGARLPAGIVTNDLEPAAVSLCPAIAGALDAARGAGAEQAIVSGSGPTVVGIWWGADAAALAATAAARLARRYPGAVAAEPVTPPTSPGYPEGRRGRAAQSRR